MNLAKVITSTWGGPASRSFRSWQGDIDKLVGICTIIPITESGDRQVPDYGWLSIGCGLFIGVSEGAERALTSDYANVDEARHCFWLFSSDQRYSCHSICLTVWYNLAYVQVQLLRLYLLAYRQSYCCPIITRMGLAYWCAINLE